jgi:hypothetical protein
VAVEGEASGVATGIAGSAVNGRGVLGTSDNGVGVEGSSSNNDGVRAITADSAHAGLSASNLASGGGGYGVWASASGSGHAVHGENTNASGWAGYFDGKVFASGGFTPSDARLKKEIADLPRGLTAVTSLRAVSFKWKDQSRGTGNQIGFMAQDLQKLVPEVVDEDAKSGMLSVNYPALVPVLVKAVQEQQAIIERQESRIASLERRPIVASMSSSMSSTLLLGAVGGLVYLAIRRRAAKASAQRTRA